VLDTLENSPEDTVVIPGSLPATDCLHELVLINGRGPRLRLLQCTKSDFPYSSHMISLW